jgi:hypothetical protein
MLNMSGELELDHYFPNGPSDTNGTPLFKGTESVPPYRMTVPDPQPPVENPTDRQSTKVKALKLEDGDISPQ